MSSVTVPLGLDNIKRLQRQLKTLAKEMRLDMAGEVERAVAVPVAALVRENIAGIADLDGNYLGGENPNASVVVEKGLPGHDVIWRGKQIPFLEFGTGAAGVGYPGVAMATAGYAPDPTKQRWTYKDAKSGEATVSEGIPAYAPMYNAATAMRLVDVYGPARMVVREAITSAVTV